MKALGVGSNWKGRIFRLTERERRRKRNGEGRCIMVILDNDKNSIVVQNSFQIGFQTK